MPRATDSKSLPQHQHPTGFHAAWPFFAFSLLTTVLAAYTLVKRIPPRALTFASMAGLLASALWLAFVLAKTSAGNAPWPQAFLRLAASTMLWVGVPAIWTLLLLVRKGRARGHV